MTWPPVPLRSTLGDWAGKTIAVGGQGDLNRATTALLHIGKVRGDGHVRIIYSDMAHEKLERPAEALLPADLTVSEAVLGLAHVRPDRAAVAPKVTNLGNQTARSAVLPLTLTLLTMLVMGVILSAPELILTGVVIGAVTGFALLAPKRFHSGTTPPRVFDQNREVFASGVYANLAIDDTVADPRGLSPRSRVDLVKERFGALRDDIVYRIENSALFDAAVPETQRLELALLAWDEMAPNPDELATEVEAAFDAARTRAEELGLDHLPETARDSGRRAARAAHTALHAESEGEREAARRRVAEILGSLALYYLPPVDPTTPTLIGQRKQIEPR